MSYDFSLIYKDFPIFIPAVLETLKIAAASIIVGVIFGLVIAF